MRFIAKTTPPQKYKGKALWFCFKDDRLLVQVVNKCHVIPCFEIPAQHGIEIIRSQYLGILDGKHCFGAQLSADYKAQPGMHLLTLRKLYGQVDELLFSLARRAYLIVQWDQNHQYCGRCGMITKSMLEERAKICPNCGFISYPRIVPAIIVAVIKDNSILLAHAKRFKHNIHSVIAGFVEPGESLEECIGREVFEEVGIKVKNISYFKSQSWPFPNSLMIAFTAHYAGGEIEVDGKEIDHAGWYTTAELPEIPPPISISRELIDWFVEKHRQIVCG